MQWHSLFQLAREKGLEGILRGGWVQGSALLNFQMELPHFFRGGILAGWRMLFQKTVPVKRDFRKAPGNRAWLPLPQSPVQGVNRCVAFNRPNQ